MSPSTMNIIYFVTIAIFGLVMVFSPHTFMGRAKYSDGSEKTQKLIKKVGIVIIVVQVILIIYTLVR